MKIIGLAFGKNEEGKIGFFLQCLSLYTDTIIYLDNGSTDRTLEIVHSLREECRIESILTNPEGTEYHESRDRQKLLNEGRAAGGSHFVCLDCDEIFTSNMHVDGFRDRILGLKHGDSYWLTRLHCWRSPFYFRRGEDWLRSSPFVFCDDRNCSYPDKQFNSPRIPQLPGFDWRYAGLKYGVAHFGFVNWRNNLVKQAWSSCLMSLLRPDLEAQEINNFHSSCRNENDLVIERINDDWYRHYLFDPPNFNLADSWRAKEIQQWIGKYGRERFHALNIWDIA